MSLASELAKLFKKNTKIRPRLDATAMGGEMTGNSQFLHIFVHDSASSEVRDTHENALDAGEPQNSEKPHTRCIGPLDRYQIMTSKGPL